MAKKDKGAEPEEGAKKKKPIKPIIIVVLALVGVKMFVLKDPEPTEAQIKAEKAAAEQELYNTCAEENGLETLGELVEGGKNPTGSGHTSETETTHEKKAAGIAPTSIMLVASTRLEASGGGAASTEGPIVANDNSVTVNLQDGSYLKLGLAVQMAVGSDAKLVKEEGLLAKATDVAITELAKHDIDELYEVKERDAIKADLSFDMCRETHAKILKIYFTEFVMQKK
jgi:flagellar basal body-associated protein FliL